MTLLPALALSLLANAAEPPNPDWNCDEPLAQQEMNWCAYQDYLAADAHLNEQWAATAAVMKRYDEDYEQQDDRPGYFDQLLAAQRAWLAFRDAHCASEGYIFRGGSMEPLVVSTCLTTLTEDRIKQLRVLEASNQ